MRVVSLVPSATETLLALGVRPVACTRFCNQRGIPTVGGTKNPEVAKIVSFAPDLVVVNDEENRREDAVALRGSGVRLHEMSPHAVADVGPAVQALAAALGVEVPSPFGGREWTGWLEAAGAQAPGRARRCVVFVWREPWMTLTPHTYGASMATMLGLTQVEVGSTDRAYPEVSLGEVVAAAPEVVVLPSEPYRFGVRHAKAVGAAIPGAQVVLVDGRDLFWWGIRTPPALDRLRCALADSLTGTA